MNFLILGLLFLNMYSAVSLLLLYIKIFHVSLKLKLITSGSQCTIESSSTQFFCILRLTELVHGTELYLLRCCLFKVTHIMTVLRITTVVFRRTSHFRYCNFWLMKHCICFKAGNDFVISFILCIIINFLP